MNATRIPSIVILGADALLAALPATPVQLAHACVLAGYQSVVPGSWGDELIAAASLRALREHGELPAIQCSCPYVAHRLLAVGTDLRPFLVSLVAPPVVLARYLRAAHAPGRLRITYVGRCPSAADDSIDARLMPEELLAMLGDRRITLEEQPLVYDSVLPPDRRRHRSQPGGLPTPDMLWTSGDGGQRAPRSLVELYGDDLPVELAQHLLSGKPVLIDCAAKLGCVCSGAAAGVDPAEARARVVALEPPRAPRPVIDESLLIDAALPLPASPRSAFDVVTPATGSSANHGAGASAAEERPHSARQEDAATHQGTFSAGAPAHATHTPPPRRLSPTRGISRPAVGSLPTARDAGGRQLPRTYVAHRRVPPRLPRGDAPIPRLLDGPADLPSALPPEGEMPNGGFGADAVSLPVPSEGRVVDSSSFAEHGAAPIAGVTQVATTAALDAALANTPARPPAPPSDSSPLASEPRYAERAIALPVTPRSDAAPRQELAGHPTGERPLMQLLTLGLLISMIVLVSAAVGVLVGRWMTQR